MTERFFPPVKMAAARGAVAIAASSLQAPARGVAPRRPVSEANAFARALVDRGGLTRAQVHAAINHARAEHVSLLDTVLATGLLPELQCYRVLADAAGLELVDLSTREMSPLALRVVPARVARRYHAMPLQQNNREILYAIDHAFDTDADRDIAFAAGRQGRPVLACRSQIAAALDQFYPHDAGSPDLASNVRSHVHVATAALETGTGTSPAAGLDHSLTDHELGYDAASLNHLRRALERPGGLILVTGPEESLATMPPYGALDHLRMAGVHIGTVERPGTNAARGVGQFADTPAASHVAAAGRDSAPLQDVPVLVLGDIRDADAASVVAQAAHAGQRVLASVHAHDATNAITRLLTLGLDPSKVAEILTVVVAQRLVRQTCPVCAGADTLNGALDHPGSQTGTGCDRCENTGDIERAPIIEVLLPDDRLRQAIARGGSASEMRRAMRDAGCPSMRDHGMELVRRGVIALEDLDRVVADDRLPGLDGSFRRRVLIVDDDPVQRRLARALLEREGLTVIEGDNGAHAIEISCREQPDLLLCDLLMPEVSGFDAIARIRREPSLVGMPIIVLTADDSIEVEQRILALGADDYLRKPIDGKLLLSRVRAIFHRATCAAAA